MTDKAGWFYRHWHEAMQGLTDAQYGQLARAANGYRFSGEEASMDGTLDAIYRLIKSDIDAEDAVRANRKERKALSYDKSSSIPWGGVEHG